MSNRTLVFFAALFCLGGFAPAEGAIFDREGWPLPDSRVNSSAVNWELLSIGARPEYNGIGQLDLNENESCTAVFLDTGAGPDGPAYILTNGHCADPELPDGRAVWTGAAAAPGMRFHFNSFFDAGAAGQTVRVSGVAYATMHATDVAVLALDATFGRLTARGYLPFRIAAHDPEVSTPVLMVGIPRNGVRHSRRFLRMSACSLGPRVNLREGVYEWTGAYEHQCSAMAGSSGSPLISTETREIVAIDNTAVDGRALGKPECALDRPCEVLPGGQVRTNRAVNYAQRVTDIASCIRADGVIDLEVAGCRLERPSDSRSE